MSSRRAFIASSLTALSYALLPRATAAQRAGTLRVGTMTDDGHREVERGLVFGADEANRSAQLFDWRVERVALGRSGSTDADRVHAIVDATDRPAQTPVAIPLLRAACANAPLDDRTFVLPRCEVATVEATAAHEYRVAAWHASLQRFGAAQLNDRYRAAMRADMTADAWLGWLAMKILAESALRTRSTEAAALLAHLRDAATQFDGHKGVPLRFDARGALVQPYYVLRRRRGAQRWTVDREIAPAVSAS